MKTVILAGGLGTRLSELTANLPKPMVPIGGKPILAHIMDIYASHGHNDFIVAMGYKAEVIRNYFKETVELVDTGLHTMTGGRLKRLKNHVGNEAFMATYGDGLSDVNIEELIAFHKSHGKLATLTAVRLPARFGKLVLNGEKIEEFCEKDQTKEDWINGGFFVLEPEALDYIDGDETSFEQEPLKRLAAAGELMAYFHKGFWQPMDTYGEYLQLESLWKSGKAPWSTKKMQCRGCKSDVRHSFCNLGSMPFANSYLKDLKQIELAFPLHTYVCEKCFLVQLGEFQSPSDIFSDYAYFSSFSSSWVEHARNYVEKVTDRFDLNSKSFVTEIASNDGYLLQHFVKKQIPALGIEPAKNVADAAIAKGIPTKVEFFGTTLAANLAKSDLIIANNVLAHVPNLTDFVSGIKIALKNDGVATLEFPHLLQLMKLNQFDTIYHEHFSYFSLHTVETVFKSHGLEIFDVEELPTHGGSLRLYVQHERGPKPMEPRVAKLKEEERSFGLSQIDSYLDFSKKVTTVREKLIAFLNECKAKGKTVAGYGAPAKGNTLLNYCGITPDLLPFTVDLSPHKQGHFLPGSHIPIYAPEKIKEFKPDYLLILPWNLKTEIQKQMNEIRSWGGQFVVPIPEVLIE